MHIKSLFSATNIIIASCVLIFLLAFVLVMASGNRLNLPQVLVILGAENLSLVLGGEVWRIILSTFLHADLIHLALNMYGVFAVGKFIESYFGSRKMFMVFVIAGAFGSIASLTANFLISVISFESFSINAISVGASGGLFGLLGLLLGNKIKGDIYSPELPVDERSLLLIIFINLFYGFWVPGINNWAHIGGLVSGIMFGLFLRPKINFSGSEGGEKITNLVFFITLFLVIASFILHIINLFTNYL